MRALLSLLLLVSTIAFSQTVEKKNEDQQTITNKGVTNKKRSAEPVPVVLNVSGSTPSIENPRKATNCDMGPEQSWWHKLWFDPIATFTGALFMATAALIVTGWLQWRETRNVAKKELRAYLGATPQDVKFIDKNYLQTHVEVANTGSTPARNVRQWTHIEIRDPADNKNFSRPNPGYGKRPIVPGAKWSLGLELSVTNDQLRELNSGKKVLFVWGRAEYKDIFGADQWLDFRYRNIGIVFAMNSKGERTSLGWALFAEEEGNDAS